MYTMHRVCFLLFAVQLCFALEFKTNGSFMFAGIFPLSKPGGAGKCEIVNEEGIALTEAVAYALDEIKYGRSKSIFQNLLSTFPIGFEIRDSCSDVKLERSVAFQLSMEALNHAHNNTLPKPVDIVASAFTKTSLKSIHVLSIENIPMISYSAENVRLQKDSTMQDSVIALLASIYPENVMKMLVVADLIKELQFQYVHAVVSNDFQGNAGMEMLTSNLKGTGLYASKLSVVSEADIDNVVGEISKNKRVTVVVVHCTKPMEKYLYSQVTAQNLNHLHFISTQNWHSEQNVLQPYASVLDGMIYIHFNKDVKKYEDYLRTVKRPYTGKDWIKKLYYSFGGDESCLSGGSSKQCVDSEKQVTDALLRNAPASVYAFDAMYAVAYALKEKTQQETLLDALKRTKFRVPILQDHIAFTDHLTVESTDFMLYNLQSDSSSSLNSTWIGSWVKVPNPPQTTNLLLTERYLRWKNHSLLVPVSTCSDTCLLGQYKFMLKDKTHCWICVKCPNDTVSNTTNAKGCFTCPKGKVSNPQQTECVKYKLEMYQWFGFVGVVIIVFIVLGVCCVLFGLGIISRNSDHELVILSGYKLLCFYLLGCLILFLSPIPLLVEPSVDWCSCYISLFNLGLTIIFSVLISRSQLVNDFFDDDGHTQKGGCGRYPRIAFIAVVLILQLLILIIGISVSPPETMENETEEWNVRYFECSSWSSYVFWIAFGYNIVLSVVGNFLSCSSTKMEDTCEELKYVLISYLLFYLVGLFEIVIFHRYVDRELAEAQAFMCIIFGFVFFFTFFWPKIYIILFKSNNDGKSVQKETLLSHDEDSVHLTTAVHASAGFRHHGVVQMRIKDCEA